jgi:hypothetical protein
MPNLAPPPPSNEPIQDRWLYLLWKKVTDVVPVPATASSPGTVGDIAFDSSHLYICIATDTWMRAAIATF